MIFMNLQERPIDLVSKIYHLIILEEIKLLISRDTNLEKTHPRIPMIWHYIRKQQLSSYIILLNF
jgi:hypothetical protein